MPARLRIGSAASVTPLSTSPKYISKCEFVDSRVAIVAPVDGSDSSSYGPRTFTLQPLSGPAVKPPALLNNDTARLKPSYCSCPYVASAPLIGPAYETSVTPPWQNVELAAALPPEPPEELEVDDELHAASKATPARRPTARHLLTRIRALPLRRSGLVTADTLIDACPLSNHAI